MTDEELNRQLSQSWAYARGLDKRIEALETWRAQETAISAWRRWALPVLLSIVGLALTVANVLTLHY